MDLTTAADVASYCRGVEAYLCRMNDGHLIRIVGPAFDMVSGWAARGVPIAAVCRGIDRYFDRYYAKGPRRRPVRIDFCEADVLDVFDEWRRAVGVAAAPGEAAPRDRREPLPAHLDRVIARLTSLRAGGAGTMDGAIDAIVRELDATRAVSRGLRGAARASVLARLSELDAQLIRTARGELSDAARDDLRREAESELAPFRARLPPEAYERSLTACMDRLVRDKARLPTLALE